MKGENIMYCGWKYNSDTEEWYYGDSGLYVWMDFLNRWHILTSPYIVFDNPYSAMDYLIKEYSL